MTERRVSTRVPAFQRLVAHCVYLTLLVLLSSATHAQSRKRFDPLADSEKELAFDYFARGEGMRDESSRRRLKRELRQGRGKRVLLLTERRQMEKGQTQSGGRQADVYVYDYRTDRLIHTVVDTRRRLVLSRRTMQGVQLPLIDKEVARAMAIVMRDSVHRENLRAAFARVAGEQFLDLQQVDFKAFVFHADSLAQADTQPSAACGVHRCAQLLIYTLDNVSLDYSPIVDLSKGVVTQVLAPHENAAPRANDNAAAGVHNDAH